ncbi:MAG: M42 family metallopeptidase [Oscillospiraceae bacterium]|jgi:endoglucanase|nr:M42 family metallopeptidase [Oscillospiraceae bacterium]
MGRLITKLISSVNETENTELLKKLLEARGVSGDEGEIRKLIREEAEKRGAKVEFDALGNVIASKEKEGKKRVLLDAHMDEVGFLITGATGDGCLKYQPVGGIDTRVLVGRRVLVGKEKLPGVIGITPIHLASESEMETPLKHKDLAIDIGASDKAGAESDCAPGSTAVFDSPPELFGQNMLVSRALDDRVGCYTLLRILELDLPVSLFCVFAVQEETGLRGAQTAAHRIRPDIGLAFEGTTANDIGDVKHEKMVCECGKGVAISFMDRVSISNPRLRAALIETAEANGIPHQMRRGTAGGNDAGAIQRAASAVPTCTLSVPVRYIHGANGVCCLADIDAQAELAAQYLMKNE